MGDESCENPYLLAAWNIKQHRKLLDLRLTENE